MFKNDVFTCNFCYNHEDDLYISLQELDSYKYSRIAVFFIAKMWLRCNKCGYYEENKTYLTGRMEDHEPNS